MVRRTHVFRHLSLALLTVGVVGCSVTSVKDKNETTPISTGFTGVGGQQELPTVDAAGVPNAGEQGSSSSSAKNLTASSQEELLKLHPTPEGTVFTDPDDPDKLDPRLQEAFDKSNIHKTWMSSFTNALAYASRENKPVFVWVHDSRISPPSQHLGTELLYTPEFDAWAREHVIRVMFDCNDKCTDERMGKRREAKLKYLANVPTLFGAKGFPYLIIYSPDGSRVDEWKGYNPTKRDYYFDRIKSSTEAAVKTFAKYKESMKSRGFRDWTGKNGNQIFAKLSRCDDKTKTVWLKEINGHLTKTSFDSLCSDDQAWVNKLRDYFKNRPKDE